MIVGDIIELEMFGVIDRGLPNKERIMIRAAETVNLGQYGIMIGVQINNGVAVPIRDNLLWFGDIALRAGEWLCVYTSPGTPKISDIPNSDEDMISIYWGRTSVVFKNINIVPILFRIDSVVVEKTLLPLSNDSENPYSLK
jgi:hypothetical protein